MSSQSRSSQLDQVQLSQIVKELIQEPTLRERWQLFCDELGVTDPCVTQWSSEYKRDNLHLYDLFMNILKSWQSEKGNAATKESLWETLNNVDKVLDAEGPSSSSSGQTIPQTTNTASIEKRQETKPVIWYNVGQHNKHFVGRQSELALLEEIYSSESDKIVVITGLGGIGKTELAKKFAHNLLALGNVSVTWLNGESEASLRKSLIGLAQSLEIQTKVTSGKDFGVQRLFTHVARIIVNHETSKHWLLIFDNVDEINSDLLFSLQLINEKEKTLAILTSRNRDVADKATIHIELEEWASEDAAKFIKLSLKVENSEEQLITELCKKLGNHPLGMQQAVSYIVNQQTHSLKGQSYSTSDYLEEFDAGWKKTSKILDHELNEISHKYAKTTLVTWDITLVKMKETKGEVGRLACLILELIAYLDPTEIQFEFLVKCLGSVKESKASFSLLEKIKRLFMRPKHTAKSSVVECAVKMLKAYSLIKVENKVIFIHRLVQEVIRLKMNFSGAEFFHLKFLIDVIHKLPQFPRSELAHGLSVWKYSSKDENLIAKYQHVPFIIFNRLNDFGLISEMFNFASLNYTRFKEVLGDDHLFSLGMKHNLARALYLKGEWEESLDIYKEVWEKEKEIQGEEHESTLVTAHNMAIVLWRLNRLAEAKELLEKVWESQKKTLGENHEETMNTKHSLAVLLSSKGELDVALRMFKEVLEWREEKLGQRHRDTLLTRHSIANCLLGQRKYLETKEMLEDVWELSKAELGKEHPYTINFMHSLGKTLCKLPGQEDKGQEVLQQVLTLLKKNRGVNHPFTLETEQLVQEIEGIIGSR